MNVFRASEVNGYEVPMKVTNSKHFKITNGQNLGTNEEKIEGNSFADLLRNAFYDVNSIELRKDNMMQQFMINPDSVDIHDLTNSLAKAELTFSFVRSISEKVISAYREISNLR